jgi:hypothetical protein
MKPGKDNDAFADTKIPPTRMESKKNNKNAEGTSECMSRDWQTKKTDNAEDWIPVY